jgi:hypothetical protein
MVVPQGLKWLGADRFTGTENTEEADQIADSSVFDATNFIYQNSELKKTGYGYILKEF